MFRLHHIKHTVLALLLLVSLCLTFSHEAQAQSTTNAQIELVDTQTHTKISGVSYIPLVQQAKKAGYIASFIAFSFERLLQTQNTNSTRTLAIQETSTHTKQNTAVIDYLLQHATLSDDTDTSYFPVILS